MKYAILLLLLMAFASITVKCQDKLSAAPVHNTNDPLTVISQDVARTAGAVELLSRSWAEFTRTFSSNQGWC